MAIFTRYGSVVTVNGHTIDDDGRWWIKCTRVSDNEEKEYLLGELRADDGPSEIQAAIERATV